ncbi:MAG: hypothetical protein QOG00_232 [Pyrinomonadaceae bacterium]|nr:hypothetical protein [Pyrinomonadaceae bacterium]
MLILAGAILAAFGSFGHFYFGKQIENAKEATAKAEKIREEKQKAYEGVLKAEPKILLSTKSNLIPMLQIGNSKTYIAKGTRISGDVLGIFNYNDLIVSTKEDQVKVSMLLRNKKGEVVAQLVDNEWKINKEKVWDRNYSEDALEVRDEDGDIALQIRAFPDRIQFQASLYDANGKNLTIVEGPGRDGALVSVSAPGKPKPPHKIEPMFKYPSREHLGEFISTGS